MPDFLLSLCGSPWGPLEENGEVEETTSPSPQASGGAAGIQANPLCPEESLRCTRQDLTNQNGDLALSPIPLPITMSFTEHDHVTAMP